MVHCIITITNIDINGLCLVRNATTLLKWMGWWTSKTYLLLLFWSAIMITVTIIIYRWIYNSLEIIILLRWILCVFSWILVNFSCIISLLRAILFILFSFLIPTIIPTIRLDLFYISLISSSFQIIKFSGTIIRIFYCISLFIMMMMITFTFLFLSCTFSIIIMLSMQFISIMMIIVRLIIIIVTW